MSKQYGRTMQRFCTKRKETFSVVDWFWKSTRNFFFLFSCFFLNANLESLNVGYLWCRSIGMVCKFVTFARRVVCDWEQSLNGFHHHQQIYYDVQTYDEYIHTHRHTDTHRQFVEFSITNIKTYLNGRSVHYSWIAQLPL